MKYGPDIVNRICELIASDDYTIGEICKQVDINPDTWAEWKKTHPEFVEAIKKADEQRLETFRKAARSGLLTLLQGKEFEEVTTEYKEVKDKDGNYKPRMVSQKKVKKFILPNPTSVIFALKNQDSDNFADIVKNENRFTDKEGNDRDFDLSKLSTEKLSQIEQLLRDART